MFLPAHIHQSIPCPHMYQCTLTLILIPSVHTGHNNKAFTYTMTIMLIPSTQDTIISPYMYHDYNIDTVHTGHNNKADT